MNPFEKAFSIFYFACLFAYVPCFFLLMPRYFFQVLPFHLALMAMGVPMIVIVFRDLYKRNFPNPNSKVTWAILFFTFSPSILVYLYKHGFRPR